MLPLFSASSTPPTTASMHQQSLMYTNHNQSGIQTAHQQPQQTIMYPQEGVPFQHQQTHFPLASSTDPNIQPGGHAWAMLRPNNGQFYAQQQQPQQMSHLRHPQQSATGQQQFNVGAMQPFVLVPQTPPPMIPTSICTNPYQPPPQQFPIHQAQQFQPQTGAIPAGSTAQYIRTFSNGGGSGPGGTNTNGAHINGFNPATHPQLRNFPPQQHPPVSTTVNTGIGQQQHFGNHPQHVFMLAQALPNAPPPGHFDAVAPIVDRQFQQQPPMPSHLHTSTAPSLVHQQLMQTLPQIPPPQLQQPPPQSAPPLHQSPPFHQQSCAKEKRPLSIQAPGSAESGGDQHRDESQSGRQSTVFSNPSPQLQRQTPPTPTNNVRVETVNENANNVKTDELNVGDDYRNKHNNRQLSNSNKNGGTVAPRSSFYQKFNQQPSQDVRTFMHTSHNTNTHVICTECGVMGHAWTTCNRTKSERDESVIFASLFEKRSGHPELKNSDGNIHYVPNNYRKSENQNFRGSGFNNKNYGTNPRHQRISSGGGGFGTGGGNKPGFGGTPSVRSSGYSSGNVSGRQFGAGGGGGGNRKEHQKNVFVNKNVLHHPHT